MIPREDAPETCAETIHVTCGGESGSTSPRSPRDSSSTTCRSRSGGRASRRSRAGPPAISSPEQDRMIVDGSSWSGDGSAACARWPTSSNHNLAVSDFACSASRAGGGDRLDLRRSGLPAVPSLVAPDRPSPTRPTTRPVRRPRQPGQARLSRRLAGPPSRLRLSVTSRLAPVAAGPGSGPHRAQDGMSRGMRRRLSDGRAEVGVIVRPAPRQRTGDHPAGRAPGRAVAGRAARRRDAEAETVHVASGTTASRR